LFLYTLIVVYRGCGLNVPISGKDVEEMLLFGTLHSQILHNFGQDFYYTFNLEIKSAHYPYLKESYWFSDE
jgi:hypothetical protein